MCNYAICDIEWLNDCANLEFVCESTPEYAAYATNEALQSDNKSSLLCWQSYTSVKHW